MDTRLVCWKCGASLGDIPLPLGRLAECLDCHAEQHVCRACEYYDARVAKQCREPIAEEVQDKSRANYCDYFQLRPDAYYPHDDSEQRAARAQLDALFGGSSPAAEPTEREDQEKSPEQRARESLEALFPPAHKEH